jgi:hypothetical protein
MAAQAWSVYGTAKLKLGAGTISFPGAYRIGLVKSSSNFATFSTLSTWSVVTNEVTSGNGYSTSGKTLANESWNTGASSLQMKFDADDVVWTATGGNITSIKAAVIWASNATPANEHLLCAASLTSSEFTLSSGNTLTIQMNASGILTLT